MLDAVRGELQQRPMVASQQTETFIRCARIADAIDPDAGSCYFKLAMDAASDIDEEACTQLNCLSQLSKAAAEDDPALANPHLAHDLARFTEACHYRMEGWDHFPWTACLKGIVYLDPASAFTVLSRWDERRVRAIEDEILPVLVAATERNFLAPATAYALTILSRPWDDRFSEVAVYLLEQAHKNRNQNRLAFSLLLQQIYSDIALYSPLERRAHRTKEILDCVQKNRIEKTESISSLEQLHNFLEGLKEEKQHGVESGPQRVFSLREEQAQEPEIRWEDILNDRTFSDPREIEEAIDIIAKTKTVGHRHLTELLERIKSQCQLP